MLGAGLQLSVVSCASETRRTEITGVGYSAGSVFHGLPGEVPRMFDRITFERNMMGGRACIRGMRIPVSVIVGQFAHGATEKEILADYPDLEAEDIRQALEYAAWLTQEEVHAWSLSVGR